MKVIFLEDVTNVARAGDTKEVADGFGRNFLLPRKLAVLANSVASTVVEAHLKKLARQRAQSEAEMTELAGKINGLLLTLKGKAGAKDRLYGSITSADIADELNRSAGLSVDKRKIELLEPIHKLGNYDVPVKFTHDITATLKVTIVGENGEVAQEEVKPEAKIETKAEEKVEAVAEAKPVVKAVPTAEEKAAAKAEKKAKKDAEKAAKAAEKAAAKAVKPEKAEKPPKTTKVKAAKAEAEPEAVTEEKPEVKEEKKPRAKAEKKVKKKVEEWAGPGDKEE